MRRLSLLAILLTTLVTPPLAAQGLADQVQISTLTLPHSLEGTDWSWCTWSYCYLGPRLFHEPRADGSLLAGWTDSSGNGHVSLISGGALGLTHDFAGTPVKGLVAHDDGSFAVLLWDHNADIMWLSLRSSTGAEVWSTNLNSSIAIFDNDIGDSRLAFDGTYYIAYYTVYGISGLYNGHNGDQLRRVSTAGVLQAWGWSWGCSHSMAELISFHQDLDQLMVLCASDAYPQEGLIANSSSRLVAAEGNAGGMVSLQLGQVANGTSTWKVLFNALDETCCDAHGIGLATVNTSFQTDLVWLTDTDGSTERDPVIARLPDNADGERYLVGWRLTSGGFQLAIINGAGSFLAGPEAVSSAGIGWNQRDDSFRSNPDGSITWLQASPLSSTLHLLHFTEDLIFSDGFETANPSRWSVANG